MTGNSIQRWEQNPCGSKKEERAIYAIEDIYAIYEIHAIHAIYAIHALYAKHAIHALYASGVGWLLIVVAG